MQLRRILSLGLLALLLHAFNDTAAAVDEYIEYETTTATNSEESTTSPQWYSTPITSSARLTPTTTTTAVSAMAPRDPSEEELRAQSLLNETQDVIDSTHLHFYQRKTQLSLNFINKAIPALQEIKHDMSNLLNASASYSYTSFKEADDVLENELTEVEKGMERNRASVERYLSVYNVMTEKIREVHGTLGDMLLPGANANPTTTLESSLSFTLPPLTETDPAIGTSSDCGGIINAHSGLISYKVGQALSSNEGCLWVMKAESNFSARFAFKLRSSGFIATRNTFLSIGYFKNSQYSDENSFVWKKLEPGSDTYDVVVEAPVVFIHFVSSPAPTFSAVSNRGFVLQYQVQRFIDTAIQSHSYINEFIAGPQGTRRYPQSGRYTNNERTAIVLQPTLSSSVLQMNWWDFEGDSIDTLSIWSFGTDLVWGRQAKLGGNRTSSSIRRFPLQGPRNDPFLLVFRSDSSIVRDGFEFQWGPYRS